MINPENDTACEIKHVDVGSYPTGVIYAPNSNNIYIANSWSNTISVMKASKISENQNLCNGYKINSIQTGINPTNVYIDSENHIAYVANSESNNVSIINLASKDPSMNVTEVSVGSSPSAISCG